MHLDRLHLRTCLAPGQRDEFGLVDGTIFAIGNIVLHCVVAGPCLRRFE